MSTDERFILKLDRKIAQATDRYPLLALKCHVGSIKLVYGFGELTMYYISHSRMQVTV